MDSQSPKSEKEVDFNKTEDKNNLSMKIKGFPPQNIFQQNQDIELEENIKRMNLEFLPGSIKNSWVMHYKHQKDLAIEKSLEYEPVDFGKRRTKGTFQIDTNTNGGNWIRDRDWKNKANTVFNSIELQREEFENRLLIKKKEQKRVQYMALEN